MSRPKYIYIDDENDGSITSLINGFNDTGLIEVHQLSIEKGLSFSVLESLIKSKITDENYDGLLIDLRLDGEGPNQLEYSAISISSELRSVCARNELKSFPIILCSTLDKIKETYKSDKTSHDLFDYTFRKSESKLNSLILLPPSHKTTVVPGCLIKSSTISGLSRSL